MPHVFLSYAWLDGGSLARWLHTQLNALDGWSAWMDSKLHADTIFSYELQTQIDRADLVVVVISPDVNRGETPSFVQRELAYATQPGVDKPVFAARAADCPLPLIIAGYTYQDFFDTTGYDSALLALLEKIGRGPRHLPAISRRERELAYLRRIAQEHGFWGKVYVDTAAEARVRPSTGPDGDGPGLDPDIAAYLGELMMAIHPEGRHSPDDDTARETVETFEALTDALAHFERVAIIGDPGCGKTTTLRRFAYDLADKAARDEAAPLPVFVALGGYTGGDLGRYIAQQFAPLHIEDYLPDRAVILLDGLNETNHENVPAVQAWLNAHPTVRVLLTCRKLDYVERKLELQRVDVLPLDTKRILQFMAAYGLAEAQRQILFTSLGTAGDETLRATWEIWQREGKSFDDFWFGDGIGGSTTGNQDNYLKQIRTQMQQNGRYPGLLGLIRNPFLLTLTITIFVQTGTVPRNRSNLFADFVHMLFAHRGKLAARTRPPWIAEETQQQVLIALAYRMQMERRGTRVPYAWARGVAAEVAPSEAPDQVLYLAASAGILDIGGGDVRFTHQLLQEYFAAYGLRDAIQRGASAANYWPDDRWWEPTGWEETAILLAGLEGDATDIARWLTPVQPILAYLCATESGVPCEEDIIHALYEPPDGARTAPVPRAIWGRKLAERGDPRLGVLAPGGIPDITWCEVPAGQFVMGGDPNALGAWAGEEFDLAYTFWIAKYPVTYSQYTPFVISGGYRERRYWTSAGWMEKGKRTEPYLWNDPKWHIANHPIVGVTWYEAQAYTQWLNKQAVKRPFDAPTNYAIRLARECEWEKAARYPDSRHFPWGNNWDPTLVNWGGNGTARTSAVGLFTNGRNPVHGTHDVIGNVWEWCLTEWRDTYKTPDAENNDLQNNFVKCTRGGSWFDTVDDLLRCATRYCDYPYNKYSNQGFRIVYSIPI